jgi:hypothetical protein
MQELFNMNTLIRSAFAIPLATTTFLLACGGANQDASTSASPGTARAGVASAQRADTAIVNQLATARCDREQTCNNVGASAKYASRDVCMDQMRGSLANDLNAYDCPRGIDSAQIDRCMAAIRNEECSHPLDTLSRIEHCRTGALCLK